MRNNPATNEKITEVLVYDDKSWTFEGEVLGMHLRATGEGLNVGMVCAIGVRDNKEVWHELHHAQIADNFERAEWIPYIIEAVQQEADL